MAETGTDLESFVATRGTALLRHAYVLTGDRDLAQDLVQEVLAHLVARWDRVAASSSPEAYCRTSITRQFLSWRRRRWWGERPSASLPERGAPELADIEGDDAVWRLLATLPRRQRVVLALRYYDDQSDAQIAQTLGISASSVRAQASRGLATLRSRMVTADVRGVTT